MVRVAESALRVELYAQPAEAEPSPALHRYHVPDFLPRHGQSNGGISGTPNRSVKPAELAQAHIFKSTLHDELVRLTRLASRLGGPAERAASGPAQEDRELARLRAAIDEVRRMLEGLTGRFGTTD
jgi:hypothetical protein